MKISIEYAHIYVDEDFSEEHEESIRILHKLESELEASGNDSYRLLMIDDYSPVQDTLDQASFLEKLDNLNARPDFKVYEGELDQTAIMLLKLVEKNRLRKSYERYISKRNGYIPCSLFIATWYLVRLGLLYDGKIKLPKVDRTITILPRRFEEVEAKGLELIENTKYAAITDSIEQIFFDEHSSSRSPKF